MGDGIMVFVFCQESLMVMGLRMVLKGVQKNSKSSKNLSGFDLI